MTDATLAIPALHLPAGLHDAVDGAIERAVRERWASRLWERDTSLWTDDRGVGKLISERLGWLDAPASFRDRTEELQAFALGVRAEGFEGAVVCGMGGSSLAPEVLARSFALPDGGLRVRVLDSTDPVAVRAAQAAFDPARALYLIASKSGTTTETLSFLAHFWQVEDDLHADIPASAAGQHFVAITDPGRPLGAIPHSDLFRGVFLNPPDVGGRYSALTYVGLVPAALMSLDLGTLLDDAALMAERCREPEARNPGLWLGAALAGLARAGRDKLTLVIEPRISSLGAWLEQLVAESTGKRGVGLIPIDDEPLGNPGVYGQDRIFVRIGSVEDGAWHASTGAALDELAAAGHPVIDLALADGEGVGGEFFRWMFATAICGAGLGINPFDEPNVTESKQNTARVLEHYRSGGQLPVDEILVREPPLTLIGDVLHRLAREATDVPTELRAHIARARPAGYIGLHAYIAPTPERDRALAEIRRLLRDRTGRATTLGYGPRFLHSTGQLHKGGPPAGCFIQLIADHPDDLPIPGAAETFGTLIDAQALGDFHALEAHELPVLRVHLSVDPDAGLRALHDALERALDEPLDRPAR
ncbi:MAG: glucose-6-phosphate isomerase [Chloroflexota bacterium]|nr:glucose-6-phosphate isomerase [Chloroflexota bacterium]